MKKIFYLTGKSASGKDSIYEALLDMKELALNPVVIYTTRPQRPGEEEGREYHFVDEDVYKALEEAGEVIECRTYNTVKGPWRYFTANENISEDKEYFLGIGTLESFMKVRDRFGRNRVLPLYINVDDGERLIRAIGREQASGKPDYKEMCRRYIADCDDFSEEKLQQAGITADLTFENDDLSDCIDGIRRTIIGYQDQ